MRNLLFGVTVILVVFMFTGCASQKAWVYSPKAAMVGAETKTDKSVVVLPFKDNRKNENINHILLYMIPLAIYGSADFGTPEGVQMHMNSGLWTNYRPTEDFSKALAQELQATGLFKEAYFDFKTGDADYYIAGTIISTRYSGKLFSYGLSVYGPCLWFIGFPATTIQNELSVEIAMYDAKTKEKLFSKTYTPDPVSHVSWIYRLRDDFNYPELLKSSYLDFCKDIEPVVMQ